MKKVALAERANWRETAQEVGFTFADMHGEPYWDETSAYEFSLSEIEERIEDPSTELHKMCREAAAMIVGSEELLEKLGIAPEFWDLVAGSWARGDQELYGRFDLAYDGAGPAKLLEYNADTPTSLYESAAFQWQWLEDQLACGALREGDDQFNGIHEALVERFGAMFKPGTDLHFTAVGGSVEDYATVEAMGWAAREAGLGAHYSDLDKIGISAEGQFVDAEDRVIGHMFKLYPWEDLLRDEYAQHLAGANCVMIEPAWKAVVSNKGILPVLWQMFEGHPNLLPAFFASDLALARAGAGMRGMTAMVGRAEAELARGHVIKPLFSREGAGVTIMENGAQSEATEAGDYAAHARIVQSYAPLPVFDGFRPVIGAWIIGETCAGIGIREDRLKITQDLSRFKPHYIRN